MVHLEPFMKLILSERNIVIFLFAAVLITFVMAQEDSRKMQVIQVAVTATKPQQLMAVQNNIATPHATTTLTLKKEK